jgi:hypothetical protein
MRKNREFKVTYTTLDLSGLETFIAWADINKAEGKNQGLREKEAVSV